MPFDGTIAVCAPGTAQLCARGTLSPTCEPTTTCTICSVFGEPTPATIRMTLSGVTACALNCRFLFGLYYTLGWNFVLNGAYTLQAVGTGMQCQWERVLGTVTVLNYGGDPACSGTPASITDDIVAILNFAGAPLDWRLSIGTRGFPLPGSIRGLVFSSEMFNPPPHPATTCRAVPQIDNRTGMCGGGVPVPIFIGTGGSATFVV